MIVLLTINNRHNLFTLMYVISNWSDFHDQALVQLFYLQWLLLFRLSAFASLSLHALHRASIQFSVPKSGQDFSTVSHI